MASIIVLLSLTVGGVYATGAELCAHVSYCPSQLNAAGAMYEYPSSVR